MDHTVFPQSKTNGRHRSMDCEGLSEYSHDTKQVTECSTNLVALLLLVSCFLELSLLTRGGTEASWAAVFLSASAWGERGKGRRVESKTNESERTG